MLAHRPVGLQKDNNVGAHTLVTMVASAKIPDQMPEDIWK